MYINLEIVNIIGITVATGGILLLIASWLRGIIYDRAPIPDSDIYPRRVFFEFNFVSLIVIYFLYRTIDLPSIVFYALWSIVLVVDLILYFHFKSLKKRVIRLAKEFYSQHPNANAQEITEHVLKQVRKHPSTDNQKKKSFLEEILNYAMILITAFPFLISFMGYGDASKQRLFSVLSDHSSMAVVRKYGDEIICKNYNRKTNKLGDSLLVFKMDNSTKLNFTIKTLNP
jgi:Ca2+/Na+ antiporter